MQYDEWHDSRGKSLIQYVVRFTTVCGLVYYSMWFVSRPVEAMEAAEEAAVAV